MKIDEGHNLIADIVIILIALQFNTILYAY